MFLIDHISWQLKVSNQWQGGGQQSKQDWEPPVYLSSSHGMWMCSFWLYTVISRMGLLQCTDFWKQN